VAKLNFILNVPHNSILFPMYISVVLLQFFLVFSTPLFCFWLFARNYGSLSGRCRFLSWFAQQEWHWCTMFKIPWG